MWAIFPIQDLLGTDENLRLKNPHAERINQPANPNHYWRYRMHLNIEDLIKQTDFNKNIRTLIKDSGRMGAY
jgi:4-alpha-glucanotransferase